MLDGITILFLRATCYDGKSWTGGRIYDVDIATCAYGFVTKFRVDDTAFVSHSTFERGSG